MTNHRKQNTKDVMKIARDWYDALRDEVVAQLREVEHMFPEMI